VFVTARFERDYQRLLKSHPDLVKDYETVEGASVYLKYCGLRREDTYREAQRRSSTVMSGDATMTAFREYVFDDRQAAREQRY